MSVFNKESRIKNVVKSSSIGIANQIVSLIMSFVYRTVFIMVLDKAYLGLNGLFSDILAVLSLVDLGIGTAIVYRLYLPIKNDDVAKVAAVMRYFRNVYMVIAAVITVLGLAFMPLLKFIVSDTSGVPADINISVIYLLFLAQTVASYLFVYQQSLVGADQRSYLVAIYSMIFNVLKYGLQIAVLFVTKKFIWTLVSGIIFTIIFNIILSAIVRVQYKEVFSLKNERLSKEEKKSIMFDTKALLFHKVGGTVLQSTDAIVISSMLLGGLVINGVYSNYILIITAIKTLINQFCSPMTSGIGNVYAGGDMEKTKEVFDRLQFFGLWLSGFCAIELFVLLNPFIFVWQGDSFIMGYGSVTLMCVNFFLIASRNITGAFMSATGYFNKDRYRALIEAALNLGISILLVKLIGFNGVLIGTVVSCLATVWWREPLLLYKFVFKKGCGDYWRVYWIAIAAIAAIGGVTFAACYFIPNNIGFLILKFFIVGVLPNALFFAVFYKNKTMKYYRGILKNSVVTVMKKIGKKPGSDSKGENQ